VEAGLRSPSIRAAGSSSPAGRTWILAGPCAAVLAICLASGLAISGAGLIGLVGQTRALQFAAFILGFGALLPLSVAFALRLSASERDPEGMRAAAIGAGIGVVGLLCLMRLAGIAGAPGELVSALGLIGGLAAAGGAFWLARRPAPAIRGEPPAWASALASVTGEWLALLAAGLVAAAVLVFAPTSVSPAAVAVAAVAGAAVALLRRPLRGPRFPTWMVIALDAALLALAALLVVDVTGYWGQDFAVSASSGMPPEQLGPIAQIHQHFYLGPVNDVLHGRALLVDANSVYGIGNAYLMAAWFQVAPLGYGPFGLFGSLFSVLVIVLGWGIARFAGVPRSIAAATVALAVMLTVLAPLTSPSLFLNVGGLRFAPPFLLLAVALLVSGRDTPVTRSPWVLAAFAFFSLWSLEAITYCGCTYLGLLAAEAIDARTLRGAVGRVLSSVLLLLGACIAAHLLFAVLTRTLGGGWPDWGAYVSLFKAWSDILANVFGGFAEPWSRAWLLGGVYVASAVGAVLLLRSGDESVAGRRTVLAIVGMTATGASFLSYFVAHSSDVFLPYVAYPALLVAAMWISLALGREGTGGSSVAWSRAALGTGAFAAILIVAGSWSAAEDRLPRTALAHLIPGGPSLREDAGLMWSSPPIDPRAVPAEELIDRHFSGEEALVLTEPDLGQEELLRSGRANLLPISYPWQDEVDLGNALPAVEDAVAELKPGTPILTQGPLTPEQPPSVSLLFEQAFGNVPDGARLGPLAQAALDAIRERFDLETVATGPDGLRVSRLVPKPG